MAVRFTSQLGFDAYGGIRARFVFDVIRLWPTLSCRFFAIKRAVRSMLPPGA